MSAQNDDIIGSFVAGNRDNHVIRRLPIDRKRLSSDRQISRTKLRLNISRRCGHRPSLQRMPWTDHTGQHVDVLKQRLSKWGFGGFRFIHSTCFTSKARVDRSPPAEICRMRCSLVQMHTRFKPQKPRINDGSLVQSNGNSSAVQLTPGLGRRLTPHSKQLL